MNGPLKIFELLNFPDFVLHETVLFNLACFKLRPIIKKFGTCWGRRTTPPPTKLKNWPGEITLIVLSD